MATLYPEIKTNNWQISTAGVGVIAEGLADIRQCLDILLRTKKGDDPLRPEFGSDIFRYIGMPLNIAIPNVILAIIDAAAIWEKRVTIKSIRHELMDASRVKFFVTYQLIDQELIDLLVLYMNGGYLNYDPVATGTNTFFGLFPPNPSGKRYTILFSANGSEAAPAPPLTGFSTPDEMYYWVVANWGGFGTWVKTSEKIILYANADILTGSITISLTGVLRFPVPVPNLLVGQDYAISFIPDGVAASPAPPASFVSLGEMFDWVQTNWASYGTWTIEGNPYGPGDFDIQDFNPADFNVGTPAEYLLVLYSETVNTCSLIINVV